MATFIWATQDQTSSTNLTLEYGYHGTLEVQTGNQFSPSEGEAIAQSMLDFAEPKDLLSFFAPDYAELKVNDYNFDKAGLAKILKEGKAKPTIMGRWQRRKDGSPYPVPFLAFLKPRPKKTGAKTSGKKSKVKGNTRVFTRS